SALALLAIGGNEQPAKDALRQATRHSNPTVRAQAVRYLGVASLSPDGSLPPEAEEQIQGVALNDHAFEPRYQARGLLQAVGTPAPPDNSGGVYVFKV